MIVVAVAGWIVYVLVALLLRTLIQLRQTGSSGFVGVRSGASVIERIAGVMLAGAFVLSLAAPFVGAPLASTAIAGAVIVVIATAGTFAAQLAMSRSWRIGVDPHERTELVTRGAFALVRNPIFSWMIVAIVGIALACPTPLALVAPVLLIVGLQIQVRVVEEPYLVRTHGETYAAYARRTGRFVPGIGKLTRRSSSAAAAPHRVAATARRGLL
ncbi:MAG: isoprenylcysteine carboxylmethyltransferase family protein [Sandaracinaceae bacterium]|nr:isoprenylcysteine carboxylmethyltransferase family protein [Sandaracinaceae bacterium]